MSKGQQNIASSNPGRSQSGEGLLSLSAEDSKALKIILDSASRTDLAQFSARSNGSSIYAHAKTKYS